MSYAPIAVFIGTALLFVLCMWGLHKWVSLRAWRTAKKSSPRAYSDSYECGEVASPIDHAPFVVPYYVFVLLFVLFEVELLFLFPWAVSWGTYPLQMWLVAIEGALFIGFLLLGLVYALNKVGIHATQALAHPDPVSSESPHEDTPHTDADLLAQYERINQKYAAKKAPKRSAEVQ